MSKPEDPRWCPAHNSICLKMPECVGSCVEEPQHKKRFPFGEGPGPEGCQVCTGDVCTHLEAIRKANSRDD